MKDIDIIQQINDRKDELARLSKAVARISEIQEELKVLSEAYRILTGKAFYDNSELIQNINHTISNAKAAEEILREAGEPKHLDFIHDQITNRYNKVTSKAALNTTLSKMSNEGKIFERTHPGTYGLNEWSKAKKLLNKLEMGSEKT